jgi:hypothetical protein
MAETQASVRTDGSLKKSGNLIAPTVVTVAAAVAAMALGQRLWPNPAGAPTPPSSLLPLLIGLEAVTAIVFGLGIAFLVFGYGAVASARQPLWLTYATYISIAWLLVSWWPHGNLHRVTLAGNWTNLLAIDYGFHLTLMAAAGVVAVFFLRTLRESRS